MTPPYAPGQPGTAPPPPAQYGPPPTPAPARPRRRVWVLGLVGAATFAAAAALAVVGSFQTLYWLQLRLGQETTSQGSLSQTLWETATSGPITGTGLFPDTAGLPVVAGAGLLVVAAVVAVVAAFRPAGGLVTTARVVGGIGAGALAGTVGLIALTVSGLVDRTLAQSVPDGGRVEINTDIGLVLLLVGAAVGLLALVPALLPVAGAKAARVEPATPPMGFRAPGGYPRQAAPGQHPGSQARPQQGPRQAAPFPQTGATPSGAPQHAARATAPQSGSPQHAVDDQPEGNSDVTQVVAKAQAAGAPAPEGSTDSIPAPQVEQAAPPAPEPAEPASPTAEPVAPGEPVAPAEPVAAAEPEVAQEKAEQATTQLPTSAPAAESTEPAEPAEATEAPAARVFEPTPGEAEPAAAEPAAESTVESTVDTAGESAPAEKAPEEQEKPKTDG